MRARKVTRSNQTATDQPILSAAAYRGLSPSPLMLVCPGCCDQQPVESATVANAGQHFEDQITEFAWRAHVQLTRVFTHDSADEFLFFDVRRLQKTLLLSRTRTDLAGRWAGHLVVFSLARGGCKYPIFFYNQAHDIWRGTCFNRGRGAWI